MFVLARTRKTVKLFQHRSFLCAQLVLSGLVLHILNDGLVGARTWRVFHGVDGTLIRGILRTVFAHIGLGEVVGAGAGCGRDEMLLFWSLLSSNSRGKTSKTR